MSLKSLSIAACLATSIAFPVVAETQIMIHDAYARSAGAMAKAGAAFMTIMNHGSEDDRLIAVRSDVAKRTELHTHKDMGDGVMKMMEVEEGFAIPAGGKHELVRGADHVMFMGLTQGFEQGEMIEAILVFEKAGAVAVQIPVDLKRKPNAHAHSHAGHNSDHDESHGEGHGDHSHGSHDH